MIHSGLDGVISLTAEEAGRLRDLVTLMVSWECEECRTPHTTPKLLWPHVVFNLVCTGCRRVQKYEGYLDKVPVP